MSLASFKASGFDDLDRQFAKLLQGVPVEEQRAALHDGGQIIVAEAQRLVRYRSGLLHDSIMVTDERDARLYGKLNGSGISVYVGPVGSTEDGDVYYAKFQEFGTVNMPANAFMRPAIASKRVEAEHLVMTRLATAVLAITAR